MKKLLIIFLSLVAFTIVAVTIIATPSDTLYLLNWGEYIDEELMTKFEKEFNCKVILETVTSSEAMYQKISAGVTAYDVAIPGDYMVKQLYDEGYLKEIDVNNTKFKNLENYQSIFTTDLTNLKEENMKDSQGNSIAKYYMPYFWGAYSIIYNEAKKEVVNNVNSKGFEALYNRSLYSQNVNIGMYSTARWTVASYLMANGYNPNITNKDTKVTTGDIDQSLQNDIIQGIKNARFSMWGDDALKREVAIGNLDMCFTQLGDFFDALYLSYDEGKKDIDFNVVVPEKTAAFFDAMVIPTTSKNTDLANAFINFMLDPDNAYQNACAIGYSPTLKSVCSKYLEAAEAGDYYFGDEESEVSLTLAEFLDKYPMYLNPLVNSTEYTLFEPKSTAYLTTCETIVNKAKA